MTFHLFHFSVSHFKVTRLTYFDLLVTIGNVFFLFKFFLSLSLIVDWNNWHIFLQCSFLVFSMICMVFNFTPMFLNQVGSSTRIELPSCMQRSQGPHVEINKLVFFYEPKDNLKICLHSLLVRWQPSTIFPPIVDNTMIEILWPKLKLALARIVCNL